MAMRLCFAQMFSILLPALFCMVAGDATAESVEQLQARLVGKTLYLRGFWMGTSLEFDGSGKPLGQPKPGPVTLSGFHVLGAKFQGKNLVLHGERIALVAGAEGHLEPQTVHSTTLMFPSGKKFLANEEVKIAVRPDLSGNFDAVLKAVFADSLKELSSSMPPYWGCYAKGYFEQDVDSETAERTVAACIQKRNEFLIDAGEESNIVPPEALSRVTPQFNGIAGELRASGVSQVECVVTKNGIPVALQVVHALGAGLDEAALQAVSESRFKPAEKDGHPVTAALKLSLGFRIQE